MAKFFIDRPIFAIVIAIVTVILGAVAIPNLPIATYPEVVPPVVQITANLRGGNAQDLERTVAQPVEQQLVALDGMLYFFSRSSNDGVLTVDVTFDLGTNVDTAVVQTQNRVNLALPQLPPEVQREGVTVKKLSTAILLGMAFTSTDDRYDSVFLNNFITINLLDRIASLPGVGEARGTTLKNPVTGEDHFAAIVLEHGFIWKRGDCGQGNFDVEAEGIHLTFENSNWILYEFDWTNQE